jgi:diadenosine tetraphosphate (Ap4A) HIT family hydrolase
VQIVCKIAKRKAEKQSLLRFLRGGEKMKGEQMNHEDKLCCFCEEIMKNRLPDEFIEKCGIANRVFKQSDNFVAVPSISPITAGHVLIIPKQHISSMTQLKQSMGSEIENFVTKIIELVTINFGPPIIFEHGIGYGKRGGCGVNHAHLHVLPTNPDIAKRIQLIIFQDFRFSGAISLTEFLSHGETRDSYLLFGRHMKKIFYSYDETIPSQYVRKLIANEMGNSSWDWENMSGWPDFINTYRILCQADAQAGVSL